MKPHSHLPIEKPLALAATLLSLAFASLAAQSPAKAPTNALLAPTNAAPVQPEIPKSVFIIPATPLAGKDPFFPRSMRIFSSTTVVKTNIQPITRQVELHLNGISGTADHRLAIINNQTFETNEEGEVPTYPGRTRIRCLEIKPDSVLIQVGGEQRILHLRAGY